VVNLWLRWRVVISAGNALNSFVMGQMEVFGSDTIEIEMKVPNVSDTEVAASVIGGVEVTTLKVDDFEALEKLENVKAFYAAILGQYKVS